MIDKYKLIRLGLRFLFMETIIALAAIPMSKGFTWFVAFAGINVVLIFFLAAAAIIFWVLSLIDKIGVKKVKESELPVIKNFREADAD
jgi:hypothetical protein